MCIFFKKEIDYENEAGSVSILFLTSIFLLLLFFLGTLRFVDISQKKIASQARMDICAVDLHVGRKLLLENLVRTNQILTGTRVAILALRGLRLAGPISGIFGGMGEQPLLKIHQGAAAYQEAQIKLEQFNEARKMVCKPSQNSFEAAFCKVSPALSILRRNPSLFPDLRGNIEFPMQSNSISRTACSNLHNAYTKITLETDSNLTRISFSEKYEE